MGCLSQINPQTRLILVGDQNNYDPYIDELLTLIDKYNLQDMVKIVKRADTKELNSYYKVANMFLSLSEFESFGAQLIEAMWFDLPVVAYNSTAVAKTLDESAVMLEDKKDMLYLAVLINMILGSQEIQEAIISAQLSTRERYTLENQKAIYQDLLRRLTDA
jgi:glycosyltransferase involved in cell wall biosynthesis